jgi:Ca2+-binding EF-hand superfamily protein
MAIKHNKPDKILPTHEQVLQEFFEQVDEDKSGHLSRQEMKNVLTHVDDQNIDDDMMDRIMNDCDLDGSDKISFPEFKQVAIIEEIPPEDDDSDDEPDYSVTFRPKKEVAKLRADQTKYVGLLT